MSGGKNNQFLKEKLKKFDNLKILDSLVDQDFLKIEKTEKYWNLKMPIFNISKFWNFFEGKIWKNWKIENLRFLVGQNFLKIENLKNLKNFESWKCGFSNFQNVQIFA